MQNKINFSTFILGLSHAAFVSLGAAEGPSGVKEEVDLSSAQQHIDMLEVLKEKTKGNLSADEVSLLDGLLSDLRFRYVEQTKDK